MIQPSVGTMSCASKKPLPPAKIHFEAVESAYENIKSAFDAVRSEIDAGLDGRVPERVALQSARAKLYELGQLAQKEVCISLDPEENTNTQGGTR